MLLLRGKYGIRLAEDVYCVYKLQKVNFSISAVLAFSFCLENTMRGLYTLKETFHVSRTINSH